MTDEGGQPAGVAPPGGAPTPPPAPAAYGAPAPPPPPLTAAPSRRTSRPVRTIGGILGVLVILGIKLFALAGISHLMHGASPVVIFVVLILFAIFFRRILRFFGR